MPANFINRLILADGSILENSSCGLYENNLICFVKNISFVEAFDYFRNKDNFSTIIFDIVYPEMGYIDHMEYIGLDKIMSIIQRDKQIDISLEGTNIEVKSSRIFDNEQEMEVVDE